MKPQNATIMIELYLDTLISAIAENDANCTSVPVEVEGDDTLLLNQLLLALRRIEANDEIVKIVPDSIKDYDGCYCEDDLHPVVRAAGMLANICLIDNGDCNWNNIQFIRDYGFSVGPCEQDSFGWLSGVIGTLKGDVIYG